MRRRQEKFSQTRQLKSPWYLGFLVAEVVDIGKGTIDRRDEFCEDNIVDGPAMFRVVECDANAAGIDSRWLPWQPLLPWPRRSLRGLRHAARLVE